MKGRKPKPTAFRLIEGNREHRTIHAELEPKPESGSPPKPTFLNEAAGSHWDYLVKHLESMKTLAASDQGSIMGAAMAYGQISDLQAQISKLMQPDFVCLDQDKLLATARRLLNSTSANMIRFEADLGLNPTARTRIKLDKPAVQSRRERLMG
ncbi:hypothetical protein EHM92_00210 [bacterium]|nr:MAG: hypothetical protein EHM92_00210 [bacterium]